VLVETVDGVATVLINRPEVRNAVNDQVRQDVHRVLEWARGEEAVGALVFSGAGDRAFVAGADISELTDYSLRDGLASDLQRLYDDVEAFEKPTIAAVNGYALGGGCELAMATDIRIASQHAKFGLPETGLGVLPAAGGTQRLSRLVGPGRALEMILTGRIVDADEALAMGLVTSVVPPGALLDTARSTAAAVLRKGPLAVRLAKLVVRAGADVDLTTGLTLERLAQTVLYTTGDQREGTGAFLEKRPARFEGR
jgi:enoyl-CoA hydratase/carnithine racemase